MSTKAYYPLSEIGKGKPGFSKTRSIIEAAFYGNNVVKVNTLKEAYDLAKNSLYDIFESDYHVKGTRAKRTIRARIAEREFAELFGVECGDPVLYVTNVAIDQNDRPVDYSREYLDGLVQKFEFGVVNK